MPGLVRQIEAAGLPFVDFDALEERGRLTNRTAGHQTRKANKGVNIPLSPAESTMLVPQQVPDPDVQTREEKRLTRSFERGAPGDAAIFSSSKTPEQKQLAKRKSQFYGDIFAYRESNTSARERINKESMVMAEIRTNVIVSDEYTFTTDISYNLSNRYQRPESSVLVTVTHSSCLLLGGSFDPAYILTITALPSQVQPVTNKRNAMLLQRQLEESLKVPPSRGVVRFVALAEENFAFNGKTYAAEIDDLEKEHADDNSTLKRGLSRTGSKAATKKHSMRNMKSGHFYTREPLSPQLDRLGRLTPPLSEGNPSPTVPAAVGPPPAIPLPATPIERTAMDKKAEKVQRMGRRKSFMAGLFSK